MNIEQKLLQAVHELTRSHLTAHIDTETGEARTTYADSATGTNKPFKELSLFDQLRKEQASGTRSTGGGTNGSGSRAPVAIQALVLWSEIQESLNTRIIQSTGNDQPNLRVEEKLQKWAAHTLQDTTGAMQLQCLSHLVSWVSAIRGMLYPVRKTEIVGRCPACQKSFAWSWAEDEWIRNTALTAVGLDVSCGSCGSQWSGADQAAELASSLREAA